VAAGNGHYPVQLPIFEIVTTKPALSLGDLFYNEFDGTRNYNISKTATYDNEQVFTYCLSLGYAIFSNFLWYFKIGNGFQRGNTKTVPFHAWTVGLREEATITLLRD